MGYNLKEIQYHINHWKGSQSKRRRCLFAQLFQITKRVKRYIYIYICGSYFCFWNLMRSKVSYKPERPHPGRHAYNVIINDCVYSFHGKDPCSKTGGWPVVLFDTHTHKYIFICIYNIIYLYVYI